MENHLAAGRSGTNPDPLPADKPDIVEKYSGAINPDIAHGMASEVKTSGVFFAINVPEMVGVTRFELVTSAMSTQRSNQLSYTPLCSLFAAGIGDL